MAAKILSAVDIAVQFQQELLASEQSAVQLMVARWVSIRQALVEEAEAYAASFPPGAELTVGQIRKQQRYKDLEAQITLALQQLQPQVFDTWDTLTEQAVELGSQQAFSTLDSLGVGGSFNTLPQEAVENIIALTRAGQPLEALFQNAYGAATQGLASELVTGIALGKSPRAIARRMDQMMSGGLNHLLLVTRDQYNRAHRTASLEVYRQSGVVKGYVRRCARQPERTCIACIALDGTFYQLKENFEGHPQDRCTLIPSVQGVDMQPLSDGKAWFKSLPEEQQIAAMGQERWEMWKAGELSWKNMVQRQTHPVWGTSVRPKPLSTLKAKPPKTKAQKKASKAQKKAQLKEQEAKAKKEAEEAEAALEASDRSPLPKVELIDEDPVSFPGDPNGLEVVRRLGGSTGAELVRDPVTGQQFVRKRGASPDHIRREVEADNVYRALGVRVPAARLYETPQGPVKLSAFIEGKTLDQVKDSRGRIPSTVQQDLQEGFAADVLMGNRDVIGMNFDNILVDRQGRAWRIDNGASFDFRAQGGKKDYTAAPLELWSMRDAGINAQTSSVFGSMNFDDLMRSTNTVARRAVGASDLVSPGIRTSFLGRAEKMLDISNTHQELRDDGWKADYSDSFLKYSTQMENAGVFDRLPRRLIPGKGTKSTSMWDSDQPYFFYDDDGRQFDHLRGEESVVGDFSQWMEKNGGQYKVVDDYLGGQANSSWSDPAQGMKWHVYRNQEGINDTDIYWGDEGQEGVKASWESQQRRFGTLSESLTMYHAFTYGTLKRVEFPNNDRDNSRCRLIRTEKTSVIRLNEIEKNVPGQRMPRGTAESGSIISVYSYKGSEVTYQDVPHSHILAVYFHSRRPGIDHGALAGDHENEFVFIGAGQDFTWTGKERKR